MHIKKQTFGRGLLRLRFSELFGVVELFTFGAAATGVTGVEGVIGVEGLPAGFFSLFSLSFASFASFDCGDTLFFRFFRGGRGPLGGVAPVLLLVREDGEAISSALDAGDDRVDTICAPSIKIS